IRDNDADVPLLARSREQVREGASCDVGYGAVAHFLRVEVVEVRRHLVEKNQDPLVASEKLDPILLIRCLRTRRPGRAELLTLAQLLSELAPEEGVRAVAAVEGRDRRSLGGAGMRNVRQVLRPQRRVLCQQTETDEQMGLAAAHRLLEVEHSLGGGTS